LPPSLRTHLRRLRFLVAGLPRRALLTLQYHGIRTFLFRLLTFPLRLTPLGDALGLTARMSDRSAGARRWYRRNGTPVAVVIPTYGDPGVVEEAIRSIRRTTDRRRVRIVVADDGSPVEDRERLRKIAARYRAELVLGDEQRGFGANCNRGLERVSAGEDAALLNSDVVAQKGWLAVLQHASVVHEAGIVGAKLLYPDGTIQFAGTIRNPDHPEWFDHRFRGRRAELPEANEMQAMLAVTGACMYITKEVLAAIGHLDDGYEMAFEDVDYCLRAWEAGFRTVYAPGASLVHHESKTRGMVQGERELRSQSRFWERWGDWFDRRDVRAPDGGLCVIYVTQDTGVGGGHRVIFTHLNGLAERGHHPELWTLGEDGPDWFDLKVPVRRFEDYWDLLEALAPVEAIKVATWWETADIVWEASVRRGIPVYWVQDIETSYYDIEHDHAAVLATYRYEFEYFAGSEWVAEELRKIVPRATTFTPGLDTELYRPLPDVSRRDDVILALGRSNPLKDFPLTRAAYLALPEPRPELWLFGIEPELAEGLGERVRYFERPSDERVNELLNEATILLQTSKHEGFCLPPLEAMATGGAVVCTDAHGNRDFCRDGENCFMPERSAEAVREALARVLGDADLRARFGVAGRETAETFAWPRKLEELEARFLALAERHRAAAMPAPEREATR
jgi:GT2 family glycosyltransferase/glycosyltransferase involved in cell wall biosynthesis